MVNYRSLERSYLSLSEKFRAKLYAPLINLLIRFKVTPNQITIFRGLLFIGLVLVPLIFYNNFIFATYSFFLAFWLLDTIDGTLARATHTTSDRGKFIDLVVDQLGYALYCFGLAFIGLASPFLMFYHIIISGALYTVAVIKNNEGQPSDWIIRPEPNLSYLKIVVLITFAILLFWQVNYIDFTIRVVNAWMTVLFGIYFIQLSLKK